MYIIDSAFEKVSITIPSLEWHNLQSVLFETDKHGTCFLQHWLPWQLFDYEVQFFFVYSIIVSFFQ